MLDDITGLEYATVVCATDEAAEVTMFVVVTVAVAVANDIETAVVIIGDIET